MVSCMCRLDAKDGNNMEDSPHFYNEIDMRSKNRSSAADDNKRYSEDEVVFDASTSWIPQQNEDSLYDTVDAQTQSPAHQLTTATSANDDEWKFQCNYEVMKRCTKENSQLANYVHMHSHLNISQNLSEL